MLFKTFSKLMVFMCLQNIYNAPCRFQRNVFKFNVLNFIGRDSIRKSRSLLSRNIPPKNIFPQAPPNVYSSDSEDPGPELSRSHARASAMSNASSRYNK